MKLSAADERCEPCDGRGYWRDEFKKKRTCTKCNGTGKVKKAAVSKHAAQPDPAAAVEALTALLTKITKGGGIHGNPYTVPEVHAGFQALGLDKFGDPLPEPVQGTSAALSQHDKTAASGYTDCACRDCFDVAISSDTDKREFCGLCEDAGCEPWPPADVEDARRNPHRYECQRQDAYGVEEGAE